MKSLTRVRHFATPWSVAYQAPPSMEFSRQEDWSGVAISFSRIPSLPRDQTWVSRIGGRHFTVWATREAQVISLEYYHNYFEMILKVKKKKESTEDLPLMPIDWDISRQDDSVPVWWLNKAMSMTFHRVPQTLTWFLHALSFLCHELNCVPPRLIPIDILPPMPQNGTVFGDKVFKEVIHLK